eukprot:NODE_23759_length_652_cov_3.967619.p1 GENE.NODE_23759_length_652_cov_3.967619~~NODE_23759_length_652_cov_3.967619.p1  ORF type:complete len:145 (-),score=41.15 NODE_23759_length_652_cov_3.967619:114-548(-)
MALRVAPTALYALVRAPASQFAAAPAYVARTFATHSDFKPQRATAGASDDAVQQKLKKLVENSRIVLFMKGTPHQPQCGFSRQVAQVLGVEGADHYSFVDVLKYPEVREGVKKFSDWPTIPQLYIDGEFIGGCDIVLRCTAMAS